ncbi:MAG: hypothetical protein HY876_04735 [Coriobacteriales bacterium]|nr:hypothetical protein [Coriobacteriales bacterium]
MAGSCSRIADRLLRGRSKWLLLPAIIAFAAVSMLAVSPAYAGRAASGELLFYPCSSCHPVGEGASDALPNRFEGHSVTLEGHDRLGEGDAACLTCHDDPAKDPGKLKLADGNLIDIRGDIAQVCFRCHSAKYEEFKAGAHGKNKPKCTSAGCHDPHAPGSMYADALLPFSGSGFQVKVLPEREAFTPFASPPSPPPAETPTWFSIFAAVGLVAAGGQVVRLARGRQKR